MSYAFENDARRRAREAGDYIAAERDAGRETVTAAGKTATTSGTLAAARAFERRALSVALTARKLRRPSPFGLVAIVHYDAETGDLS